MRFSFCTTCKDRRGDLERTLALNLSFLKNDEEIVLLDYNSQDGLRQYVLDKFSTHIEAGRLRLYSELTAKRFFMAHAKNVCHLLADGAILINLDADNFLDNDYLSILRRLDWKKHVMLYPFNGSGGFKGRTAIRSEVFRYFGGYDEDMNLGYGYEEIDLFRRLFASLEPVGFVDLEERSCIPTSEEQKAAAQLDTSITPQKSCEAHRAICERNLEQCRFIANLKRLWGRADLIDQSGKEVKISCLNNRRDIRIPVDSAPDNGTIVN